MNKQQARKEIIETVKLFVAKGLTLGSWGNVSVRVGDTLAITPSGRNYADLKPADIVIVGEKHPLQPSSELALHQKIYRARKDINAIIHTHSIY
ncbi:MAG: class II aldolase/adducin family protein, partial [Phascolarctobacterium sp.]|nr:class II aldolase/adducin family protein [Candidatus Phascolarctobacterium caballi]